MSRTAVHDRLSTLADPTRGRVLLVLEGHELTVTELCSVLQLPQSTVSRHLRLLGDEDWIESRQEGTSRYYGRSPHLDDGAERLWSVVREELLHGTLVQHDRARVASILAQRQSKSREFFAASAEHWDSVRAELFGGTSDLTALLGLIDQDWTVGDLGCGTGRLSQVLSPCVSRVIGVDGSPEMLAAAQVRLADVENVEVRQGELTHVPIESGTLDAALLSLVLHYTADPQQVLAEAYRVLRRSGRILVVDMLPHEHVEYRQQMGHVWLGFSSDQVEGWLHDVGFERIRVRRLPADPSARGPTLFVATGRRPTRTAIDLKDPS